ncbi:MAG TPA: ATP-binding protein [Alphaproteobacteria bacterium]|nr:ATP-binding protein [Alphaproteobacteria bacterium]
MFHALNLSLDQPRFQPGSVRAYLIAAIAVAIAAALQWELKGWTAGFPYFLLFPAAVATTFICGSGAGTFAILLSLASGWAFFLPSAFSYASVTRTMFFLIGTGTVVAVITVMRAATRRVRHLNETLRLNEQKFRGLLETAPDPMVIIDEQFRMQLINARTEELFGHRRAELLDRPVQMLMPQSSQAIYLAQVTALLSNPVGPRPERLVDLCGLRKDGSVFPIEVSLAPLETETGTLVSSAIRDVTQRRQIEASLAEANKAKSEFLASVSHELRTPLNAIIGFSEMIRDAMIGPVDARYREYAGDISASGRHLQNIINDILDISKIEGGRLELREETVSISDTVEACRRIVLPMADTASVSLSIAIPDALPLIRSDEMRFRQILLNIMSNAVKFTPAGGRVRVSAWSEADGAVIAVEDTGIGMRREDIAVALEPFRQIDGVLSRRFDGTGLGLPLAKALVELHGGRLDIDSTPGEGTTVRILMPLDRVVHAAA